MDQPPWDQPATPEGRENLMGLAETYLASERLKDLEPTVIRLHQVMNEIGEGPSASRVYELGWRAAELLARLSDKRPRVYALLVAARPWISGIDRVAIYQEALRISAEIGDIGSEGWAHFGLANQHGADEREWNLALSCFTRAGEKFGWAQATLRLGARAKDPDSQMAAAEVYEELGKYAFACGAILSAYFCSTAKLNFREREVLLLRALRNAESGNLVHDRQQILGRLAKLRKNFEPHSP